MGEHIMVYYGRFDNNEGSDGYGDDGGGGGNGSNW